MNPWALVVIGIGVLLVIMGVMGSYGAVKKAITGHGSSASSPAPAPPMAGTGGAAAGVGSLGPIRRIPV